MWDSAVAAAAQLWSAHGVLIALAWGYLAAGSVLTAFVSRRSREASPEKRARGVWLMPFAAPIAAYRLLRQSRPAPWRSAFGKPQPLDGGSSSCRNGRFPPYRALLGAVAAGLFPGLGQLVYARFAQTLLIWSLASFALFFGSAHLLGIERIWDAPAWLPDAFVPDDPSGAEPSSAVIRFAVERPFFLFLCAELAAVLAWAYIDAALAADRYIGLRIREDDSREWARYALRIQHPDGAEERVQVEQRAFDVGERLGMEMDGRAALYMQYDPSRGLELTFRGTAECALNGAPAEDGAALRPGDQLEIRGAKIAFQPLSPPTSV